MLRRLRIRFVCINMALLTAMLCVILGLVYHFTRVGLEAEGLRMMQAAAAVPGFPGRPGGRPGEFPLPFLITRMDREGRLSATWGPGYKGMSEEDLRELVACALAENAPYGVLKGWQLRFLRVEGPEKCLVFSDIYQEQAALTQLTRTCIFGGCLGFLAFLAVSLILARWAVGPVERAWAQQRQFVADASHELKTPLTVILANAELLQGRGDGGPEAGHILTMSRQMRRLVEGLLDLARADSGRSEQFVSLDLSRLMLEQALPWEATFFERGLSLTEQVEEGISVKGSAVQLGRVADILLDNAQKYSAPGETVLLLRRKGRNRCLLTLSNPGETIPREELGNIFKRFYRMDPVRSRDGSCGLGLSIAQGIVTDHHGKIWVESGSGRNTFFVELPVVERGS